MRLFIAVRPPEAIRAALRAIDRPAHRGLRWLGEDRWHVTLRFLGELADVGPVRAAVEAAVGCLSSPRARLGPATRRLGRDALVVPVVGLDEVAAAVRAATAGMGRPPERRPFVGHLTLARGRGRRSVPAVGPVSVEGTWDVGEVEVVRSHLGSDVRYEVLARVPIGGAG